MLGAPIGHGESPTTRVVVVTGVPGGGKSTLARALASALRADCLSLDGVKERVFEDDGQSLNPTELRLAAEDRLAVALDAATGDVVVDIWAQPGRDTTRVARLLDEHADAVVEVLCRVPPEIAIARYADRPRPQSHKPPDDETVHHIRTAAETIGPLGVGPCLEVDTSREVDVSAVVRWLRS